MRLFANISIGVYWSLIRVDVIPFQFEKDIYLSQHFSLLCLHLDLILVDRICHLIKSEAKHSLAREQNSHLDSHFHLFRFQ